MRTIKVIDLLVDIANGKEIPKKIKWGAHYFTWFVYEYKALDELGNPNIFEIAGNCSSNMLNDEIEIIEDTPINKLYVNNELQYNLTPKPPKKLEDILEIDDLAPQIDNNMFKILVQVIKNQHRINDICDYLEYLKNKGDE